MVLSCSARYRIFNRCKKSERVSAVRLTANTGSSVAQRTVYDAAAVQQYTL